MLEDGRRFSGNGRKSTRKKPVFCKCLMTSDTSSGVWALRADGISFVWLCTRVAGVLRATHAFSGD